VRRTVLESLARWYSPARRFWNGGIVGERRGMLACVLTDVQFWVPVVVLAGGLILLEMIR
jgi:hypothetical protein